MEEPTRITVDVSDMRISSDRQSYLITHSLGSCIGLIGYDPMTSVGAMLHFQLPDSSNHGRRAKENPFMFADTGIPRFLHMLYATGASRNRIVFSMFGGANMLDDEELFKIGTKNTRAAKRLLWQQSISIQHEDVGGGTSRTITLDIGTGCVGLRKEGKLYNFLVV